MSDESFDKKIKKQLESIQPPLKEDAWKNFKRLLPVPWYVLIIRKYGNWIYGGLTTATVLTTSYLFVRESNEVKIESKPKSTIQTTTPENQTNILDKDSTITLNTTPKNSDTLVQPSPEKVAPKARESNTTSKLTEGFYTSPSYRLSSTPVREEKLRAKSLNKNAQRKINQVERTSAENRNNNEEVIAIVNEPNQNKQSKQNTALGEQTEKAIKDTTYSSINQKQQPIGQVNQNGANPNVTLENQASISNTTPIDSTSLANKLAADTTKANEPTTKSKKEGSSLNLSSLNYRLGVNYVATKPAALGVLFELVLNERLGINTGLQVTNSEKEVHAGPPEFNKAKGKRFEDIYPKRIPPNSPITEIEVQTSAYRLPIYLNYSLPLKNNWSVLGSGGTNLDIAIRQDVTYRRQMMGRSETMKFHSNPTPVVLNNLFLGFGVQYQYKRLISQLVPFYNITLQQPAYGIPVSKLGVNVAIKFNLKK